MQGVRFVSLGATCYVSWTLRRIGLQRESYPLDWVNSFDVRRAAAFVHEADHRFVAHLCMSPLHVDRAHPDGERRLYSTPFGLRLPHEFERDRSISRDDLGRRYQRRFDRLRAHCREAEFVLFLRTASHGYYEVPGEAERVYSEAEEELHARLAEVCGHRRYLLILMSHRQFFQTPDVAESRTIRVNRVVPFENGFYDAVPDEPRGAQVFAFYAVALARVVVLVRSVTLPADLRSGIRRELCSSSRATMARGAAHSLFPLARMGRP